MSSKEKKDKRKDVVQEEIQEQEKNKVDAPKIFQESFVVAKPLGVRIHKSTFRVTYVESNSNLLNRAFVGDQLIALDGQLIKSSEELQKKLSESKPTVVATFHHALFSYCEFSGSTVERLQLDKEVFRSTGRAAEIFTVCLNVPKVLDESKYSLRFTVRYDARERVQIAQLDPSGLAAIHLRVGDVIRDVNDHPIASKAMLRYYMSEAVCTGQTILLGVERLVNGDEALRDMVEASSDVLEIAQKQLHELRNKNRKMAPKVLLPSGRKKPSTRKISLKESATEFSIVADHDPTKLKPCKNAKS